MKQTHASLLILAVALALFAIAPLAQATDQIVTDPGDNGGANQLRAKIITAEGTGGGVISFNIGTATITLASVLPTINANITIDGAGKVTLSGSSAVQLFLVGNTATLTLKNIVLERGYGGSNDGGAVFNTGRLILDQVTVEFSYSPFRGGAIYTTGPLTITKSTLGNNIATSGGAIYADGLNSAITIDGSMLHDNSATTTSLGGAIYSVGPLTVTASEFASNKAGGGGAIYARSISAGTTVNITGSTFHDNQTTGAFPNANGGAVLVDNVLVTIQNSTLRTNLGQSGGAVYVGPAGHLTMNNCTLNDNNSTNGGAIYNKNVITLTNVTISGNNGSHGGGIDNFGIVNLTNVTFSRNDGTYGDSVKNEGAAATLTLSNTILRSTPGGNGDNLFSTGGDTIISQGNNLSDDATGGDGSAGPGGFLNATGDIRNTDPKLDPAGLASNGGVTQTIALLSNSPAVNSASNSAPMRDQRDYIRVGAPDRGAFEFSGTIPVTLGNISTRAFVQTGDNVLIGGFIITGTHNKRVLLRAIGPSLTLAGKMMNPSLELHNSTGALIATNDNWGSAGNHQDIANTGAAPTNAFESAILRSLAPGRYTAIVRGVGNTTGIALIEGYDLDRTTDSKFVNISTRSRVQTGDNVMIAGFIILGPDSQRIIVRALGPSLSLAGKLADPTLELRNSNGMLITSNDNWRTSQAAEIIATGIPPTNNLESVIVRTLTPARYTAIVRGKNNTTGIALVEVYAIK